MNTPEISVILPVYNAASTLDATIRSVLDQTFCSFELVVIDDGSNDESLARLLHHAASDDRIHLISRKNGGVSSARNLGVKVAKAALIAFIDADDIWHPRKLADHVALHRDEPQVAASYARIAFIERYAADLGGARTVSSLGPRCFALTDVLGENPICTASNFVIRRDWFHDTGGFDEKLSFAEDQELIARLVAKGGHIKGIDTVLTGYRFSPDGLSANYAKMHDGWRSVASRYLEGPALVSLDALYCRYLARRVLRGGGSPRLVLHYVIRGLRLDAASFLRERRRGVSTLLGAIAAPFLPATIRRQIFS
jgi:glycosyltransferase involved in cell wall biosynthesis